MKFRTIMSFLFIGLLGVSAVLAVDVPRLEYPDDGARFGFNDGVVIFEWQNLHLEGYEIELAGDADFTLSSGPIPVQTAFFDLADVVSMDVWINLDAALYWRVRAVSSGTSSPWSSGRVLYKTTLVPPEMISQDDARYAPETEMPVFEWEVLDGAVSYQVEFAMDADFEDSLGIVEVWDTALDFTTVDRSAWDPIEGIFYWRVSGVDGYNLPGPWNAGYTFSKTTIHSPQPTSPEDKTRLGPQTAPPVLSWEPTNNHGPYQLRFTSDEEGQELLGVLDIDTEAFDFGDYIGEQDWWYVPVNFFWSVATFDSQGRPGPWSPPRELTKIGYHHICAFGDSITEGQCWENGYVDILMSKLAEQWDRASAVNLAVSGTKSSWGEDKIEEVLMESAPQYILILFGANDAVDPGNCDPPFECDPAGHLAAMIQIARSRGTIPIISTILPVNPSGPHANDQGHVDDYNVEIQAMAAEVNANLVDLNEMFWDFDGGCASLFCDWGHPNYTGYDVMANGFLQGINTAHE